MDGVRRTSRQLEGMQSDVGRLASKVDGYFGVWTEESEGVASQLRDLWKELLMIKKHSLVSSCQTDRYMIKKHSLVSLCQI
jgi:hypothetical protein